LDTPTEWPFIHTNVDSLAEVKKKGKGEGEGRKRKLSETLPVTKGRDAIACGDATGNEVIDFAQSPERAT
jgi:hypothetical protein